MNEGFTLIELLVVIAIIGVLASIVLASLNTARGKGANAAIKGNLANMRAQAEIYYDSNGSYGAGGYSLASCPSTLGSAPANTILSDATFFNMLNAAAVAGGSAGTNPTALKCLITSQGAGWLVAAPLKTSEGSNAWWCVDNRGSAIGKTGAPSGNSVADCSY